jgi:hypothetical protein
LLNTDISATVIIMAAIGNVGTVADGFGWFLQSLAAQ